MKKILVFVVASVLSLASLAQNENDALRYSLLNYTGTARFMGLSGAYTAVGADFSALSQNPAGIGLYRSSELSLTPLVSFHKNTSRYLGTVSETNPSSFDLGNIGYVMALRPKDPNSVLKMFQIGIGINRLASFNNEFTVAGQNNENSLLTSYFDNSKGDPSQWDQYSAGLAWRTFLIDTVAGKYIIPTYYGGEYQRKNVKTSGGTSETTITGGANINNNLFLGLTLGFVDLNYEESSIYTEEDLNNESTFFKSFRRDEYLKTVGSGFNVKLGFIYKPVENVRFGAAFHSPTKFYKMEDFWNASMQNNYDNGTNNYKASKDGLYQYKLSTPMRVTAGVAVLFGQNGLLSGDYEYVDYRKASLSASDYDFKTENGNITSYLQAAHNLRVGAEYRVGIFALRGGYQMYGSPYKDGKSLGARKGFSAGAGVRNKNYSFDLGFNHVNKDDNYYLYGIAPAASNTYSANTISATLALKF